MGPQSKDRLAASQDRLADVLGHLLTEARMNRATLARVCAKLQIEIEDRTEGDTELGRRLIEHHGILGKLHLIPGPR